MEPTSADLQTPMMLLEHERLLYRGTTAERPEEVWDYPQGRWVKYHQHALEPAAVREIDEARAEALKTNNPDAAHYMYYDTPPWAQPYTSNWEIPDHIMKRMAVYQDERPHAWRQRSPNET